MPRLFIFGCICLPLLICSGCTKGYLYTNTTVPLVTNMNKTPLGTKSVTLDSNQVKEPLSGIGVSAEWNSRAIGDAAKRAGMTTINFADMHTFSILGGIWKKQTIQVWGE